MNSVIIIPIYKETPSQFDITSLKQCFKILGRHEVIIIAPESLEISPYENIVGKKLNIERFPNFFFKDISGYNSLMLEKTFYERFVEHEYMLIYQLDCYVFKDEFTFWCKQGYDYIGSPWLDYQYYNLKKHQKAFFLIKRNFLSLFFPYTFDKTQLTNRVGNGGFSLRKIKPFIDSLIHHNPKEIQKFKDSNDSVALYNEDVFWSFFAKNIKKPNYKKAIKFSIDNAVPIGVKLNNDEMPFGCHGWIRNFHFWKNYIQID